MKNSTLIYILAGLILAFSLLLFIINTQRDIIMGQQQELEVYESDLKAVIKQHNKLNHENLQLHAYITRIEKEINENKHY
jgi:hypothetical protein